MKDMVPKGTGNSRYLRSVANFKTLYPTYDDFVNALVAGTLPIDLNGINVSGVTQIGTALSKATLLSDETALALGFGSSDDPTINDALYALRPWIPLAKYTTAGSYTFTVPSWVTKLGAYIIGGGGSGAVVISAKGGSYVAMGGGSGFAEIVYIDDPKLSYSLVVGAGGAGKTVNRASASSGSSPDASHGETGGTSSFNGITVLGGLQGLSTASSSTMQGPYGGQPASESALNITALGGPLETPRFGELRMRDRTSGTETYKMVDPLSCINPFDLKRTLCAGGTALANSSNQFYETATHDDYGNISSASVADYVSTASSVLSIEAVKGTSYGCGGGGAAIAVGSNATGCTLSATSAAGCDGAVLIYGK